MSWIFEFSCRHREGKVTISPWILNRWYLVSDFSSLILKFQVYLNKLQEKRVLLLSCGLEDINPGIDLTGPLDGFPRFISVARYCVTVLADSASCCCCWSFDSTFMDHPFLSWLCVSFLLVLLSKMDNILEVNSKPPEGGAVVVNNAVFKTACIISCSSYSAWLILLSHKLRRRGTVVNPLYG